ncbi:MAG TPA: hypothetical protein VFA80_08315 [Xanthobacteraceae bacterium]|nr:hypothetical protein [Xanthobacteraceae bacterium]
MLDRGPRQRKHTTLPGRPEDPSPAVRLRRKVNRAFSRVFFTAPLPVLVLMCVFEREAEAVLGMFGYSNKFVSSFPFIEALYLNVTSTEALGRTGIGYFHILDAALWVSIIAWTIWLIVGVVLLKGYDPFFRRLSALLLFRFGGYRLLVNLVLAMPLPMFLFTAHASMQTKMVTIPEIFLLLKYAPGAFIFLLATAYYYGVVFSAVSILFFIWKLFRQTGPG